MYTLLKRRKSIILGSWALLLIIGFGKLSLYASTPSERALVQMNWPKGAKVTRTKNFMTLVVFAHPQCPCSMATVGELERLMPYLKGKVKSSVVVFKPQDRPLSWVKASLWEKARGIPEIELMIDENGEEAEKFGARTSGQTFLYNDEGQLVFSGGITQGRGHMGDSEGREAILTLAAGRGKFKGLTQASVFGCSLRNPERGSERKSL